MDSLPDDMGLFVLVPILIGIVFVLVLGTMVFGLGRALVRWVRNNNSPLVTVPASVLVKRTHVSRGGADSSTVTSYFVTFETADGARTEMQLSGRDYGVLVEGDKGRLNTQGTRYKGFDRTLPASDRPTWGTAEGPR